MCEVLACRICLVTDTRLYDMYKYQLVEAYETITGSSITELDGLPHQICSYCSALLLKCTSFRNRCRNSQELLKYAVLQDHLITTDYIRNIDRESHHLISPFTTTTDHQIVECIHIDNTVKEEIETETEFFKFEEASNPETSDEEPLSKKVGVSKSKNFEIVPVEFDTEDCNEQKLEKFENGDMDVVILTKQEQIDEVQARKNSLNYLHSFYKCDLCFKGFITDSTFKNHMARHDPASGPHACEVCATRWPEARALRSHVATAHERKYICRLCNHICRSSHRAKEHCKWHRGFTYVCKICNTSFSKSTSYLTHIRLQHPSNNSCEICGESFIGEYGLKMHKRKAHRDIQNSIVKTLHKCPTCGIHFNSPEALGRHVPSDQGTCDPNLRPCVHCGEGFTTDVALNEHLKFHQETIKCNECNRVFSSWRSHGVHYQRVHVRRRLQPHHPRLPRTASAPTTADSVVCEICGKKCISNATLVYHQRTHTGEKPYQCTECPKRFSVHQRLQIHVRTHTGERPFKCSRCPKAFKHKAALNRHDRVHTGVKPYSCQHCGKSFSQSNSMKTHVKTVHLKLPSPYRTKRNKNE